METNEVTLEKIRKEERRSLIKTILILPLVILIIVSIKIYQNDLSINKGEILFVSALAIGIIIVLFIKIKNANSDYNYYKRFLNTPK